MQVSVINARNVNDALAKGIDMMAHSHEVKRQACRANIAGNSTLEHSGPVVTMYSHPVERVLFSKRRNANPFFHFMEALWILAGRNDVDWLAHFNKRMRAFAEPGASTFHGAYGYRLRNGQHDQFRFVLRELAERPDSRRATCTIFDADEDHIHNKDIPCNCTLSFLIRDNALHLTVYNRSNDMVWGAYGANVVQFSTILELMAQCLKVPVGTYTQISNSFHVYEEEPTWKRLSTMESDYSNPYADGEVHPYSLLHGVDPTLPPAGRLSTFDASLITFVQMAYACMNGGLMGEVHSHVPYINFVARPLFNAWQCYKAGDINEAQAHVQECNARDWRKAAMQWLASTRLAQGKPL